MSDLFFKYIVFFALGFVQDFIITFYYRAIAKEQALTSSALSTTITLVNIFILYEILSGVEKEVASVIFTYALGNGFGTFAVIKLFHTKKNRKRKKSAI